MKCGECVFYRMSYCVYDCEVIEDSYPDYSDTCHCDAQRVARVLEQVPEVRELITVLADAELCCSNDCPTEWLEIGDVDARTRARALVGGGE